MRMARLIVLHRFLGLKENRWDFEGNTSIATRESFVVEAFACFPFLSCRKLTSPEVLFYVFKGEDSTNL